MRTQNLNNQRKGCLYVVLAAALWAVSGTTAKFLFNAGVTPFQLVQLRSTIAAVAVACWVLLGRRGLLRIERKDLPYFAVLGAILAAVHFTYLYAISRIQVAAAILLQYQAPVFVVLFSVFVKRRKPLLSTIVTVAGAVAGCYIMTGGYDINVFALNKAGVSAGLASAAVFALYAVASEYGMRSYSPWTVLFYALSFGAFLWNVFQPPLSAFAVPYSAASWCGIFFVGIFGTAVAFGLYNEGIRLIGATRASITAILEPVIAGVVSYFFIGEKAELMQMAGAALIVASILLLQTRKKVYAHGE